MPRKHIRTSAPLRAILATSLAAITVATGSASVTVQPGDTLGEIARDAGVSVTELAVVNNLSDPNLIYVGMVIETGRHVDQATRTESRHVVQPGETLSEIAAAHRVSVASLVEANGIVDGRLLAGTSIRLTPAPSSFTLPGAGGAHTVAPGETLSTIARAHGVSTGTVAELNHLHNPDFVAAGTRLQLPGGWLCPVPNSRFNNDWAVVKPDGRIHEGIDMFATSGSRVVAPVAGVVTQGNGSISGLSFTLTADDGTVYYGAHMQSAGADGPVSAGTMLGTVGSSGNAAGTSPHLHFEIRPPGGIDVNPYPALRQSCGTG